MRSIAYHRIHLVNRKTAIVAKMTLHVGIRSKRETGEYVGYPFLVIVLGSVILRQHVLWQVNELRQFLAIGRRVGQGIMKFLSRKKKSDSKLEMWQRQARYFRLKLGGAAFKKLEGLWCGSGVFWSFSHKELLGVNSHTCSKRMLSVSSSCVNSLPTNFSFFVKKMLSVCHCQRMRNSTGFLGWIGREFIRGNFENKQCWVLSANSGTLHHIPQTCSSKK